MNFTEYQKATKKTAIYPGVDEGNFVYTALGLAGEAGEVAEQVKKILRDDNGVLTPDRQESLMNEIGDVLWYVSQLCSEIGVPLNYVAEKNIAKLSSRKERNVLHGSGSHR